MSGNDLTGNITTTPEAVNMVNITTTPAADNVMNITGIPSKHNSEGTTKVSVPRTGDASSIEFWLALAFGGIVISGIIVKRKTV